MPGVTDEKIVKEIQKGRVEIFEEIINRYEKKLMRYILRMIYSKMDAEDILQDVFVKTYKNIQSFNTKMKFSSWIYRIAHNETINWIKKNRKTLDLMDHDQDIQNGDSEMYERLEKEEGLKHIKKMLTKIKPKYKEVLILRYGDDKSYDEISNILRVPKSTVGTLIRRGTKELKIVNQKNEQKQTL